MASLESTYANVILKDNFPMKEHAIVLDAYEDITIKDYILGVGKANLLSTNLCTVTQHTHQRPIAFC
ncbi:hypothetical protein K0M31_015988 [Melipona bicolor]|uniref:Uncharacterized protein n=1 Tax=Melipona bicolor TaxID=60889 RepID=A0AA40G6B2_9HYME|nr:hypothetical protein K0M31_015988 [Melipona bicolor]